MRGIEVSQVPKCPQSCAWEHGGYPPPASFWLTNVNGSMSWPACATHAHPSVVQTGWTVERHPFAP